MLRLLNTVAVLVLAMLGYASPTHAQQDCAEAIPVYLIQGASHVSPLIGQQVQTCGVVTAVSFSGYYLQDALGDDNEATSDGVFVSQRGDKPAVGTYVRLSATVTEVIGGAEASGNLSVTTLTDADVLTSESDAELPAPVLIGLGGRLPSSTTVISDSEILSPINLQQVSDAASTPFNPETDALDFYESLEGMRVSVANPVAVSAIRQFGNFSAEVFVLSDNGANILPIDARTDRGGIALQPDRDNQGDQNPERIQIQFDGTLFGSTDYPLIKVGDTLNTLTGVMGYSFGNFEVNVIGPVTITPSALEPDQSGLALQNSDVTIASYNLLNLSAVEADDDQRARIAEHIALNLQGPDIIGLQEVQDNNGDAGDCPRDETAACAGVLDASVTLNKLIDAIVAAGGPGYVFVSADPLVETTDDNRDNPDTFGGAALGNIRNAFLYNPERVRLISSQGITREELAQRSVSVPEAFDTSRDPLEAVFEFNAETLTVFNNHFSSRFGSSPIFGAFQPFVQAGEENRAAQSLAMHELVVHALEQDPAANVVVLGDLNTFQFTDELAEVLPAGSGASLLTNLATTLADPEPYSFIFEGNSQALDHIYVTDNLVAGAEADYVNVNTDFPRLFDSVVASDHDPVVARLSLSVPVGALGLTGQVYSTSALEIFWNRNPSIVEYEVYRDQQLLTTTTAVSFFNQGLPSNTRFDYRVVGLQQGVPVLEQRISLRTDPVGGPGLFPVENLTGSVYSSTALELFWGVSEFSSPPTGFTITRDTQVLATIDGRSFFEEGLAQDTAYTYLVTAFDDDGNASSPQQIQLRTRTAVDNSPVTEGPSPVTSLTALVYSGTAAEIFWQLPQAGSAAVSFQVFRDDQLIDTIDGRSFFDDSLENGTAYSYSVVPLDIQGKVGSVATVTLMTNTQ